MALQGLRWRRRRLAAEATADAGAAGVCGGGPAAAGGAAATAAAAGTAVPVERWDAPSVEAGPTPPPPLAPPPPRAERGARRTVPGGLRAAPPAAALSDGEASPGGTKPMAGQAAVRLSVDTASSRRSFGVSFMRLSCRGLAWSLPIEPSQLRGTGSTSVCRASVCGGGGGDVCRLRRRLHDVLAHVVCIQRCDGGIVDAQPGEALGHGGKGADGGSAGACTRALQGQLKQRIALTNINTISYIKYHQDVTSLGWAACSVTACQQLAHCDGSCTAELIDVDTCHCWRRRRRRRNEQCTLGLNGLKGAAGVERRTLGEGAAGDEERHLGAGGGADQPAHRLRRPDHGQVEGAGAVGVRHQRHLHGDKGLGVVV